MGKRTIDIQHACRTSHPAHITYHTYFEPHVPHITLPWNPPSAALAQIEETTHLQTHAPAPAHKRTHTHPTFTLTCVTSSLPRLLRLPPPPFRTLPTDADAARDLGAAPPMPQGAPAMGMGAEKGNGRGMAAMVGCMFLGQCVSGSQSQAAKISRVKHWREEREGVLDCLRHPCI